MLSEELSINRIDLWPQIYVRNINGCFEYMLDIAAGCFLIEEAGGKYRYEYLKEGNPHGGVKCVASTKEIFEELCAFLF